MFLDSQEIKVDFSWAHTTQTMAVGYMALGDQTPEVCHVGPRRELAEPVAKFYSGPL